MHTITAKFTVKEDQIEAFEAFFKDEKTGFHFTRSQSGCKYIEVVKAEGGVYLVWEKWNAKADWETYVAARQTLGHFDTMGPMFAAAPEFAHYCDTGF